MCLVSLLFFFQAEDGIRDLVRSRGLGDVYRDSGYAFDGNSGDKDSGLFSTADGRVSLYANNAEVLACLLYTSDAADERSSVDLGGRRIIKKKKVSHEVETDRIVPR